ncbi:hypothetical protein SCLCIDRAFT_1214317 [Scleroderma citrinum Foug A]|uniref:Uncharacterized protein n=1 Tax=Scleroderma citrinum Foug A TaxID=1036808 RepID=A0A0C3E419_9AGAM|nr:hypothetical protein SCLCIDRAFT_1214317 [Scleroderma citrinum Foug A]
MTARIVLSLANRLYDFSEGRMEFTASPRFLPNSPTILTKRYSHDLVVVTEKAEIIMRRP